jgi:hypothetical protein
MYAKPDERRAMTSDPDDAELLTGSLDGDPDVLIEVVWRNETAVGAAEKGNASCPRQFLNARWRP